MQKLAMKSMRIYAVWRKSWEDTRVSPDSGYAINMKKTYDNHYIRMDFSPANLVQIYAYYRGESVRVRDGSGMMGDRLF